MTARPTRRLLFQALAVAAIVVLAQAPGSWGPAYGQTSPGFLQGGQVSEATPTGMPTRLPTLAASTTP